MTINPIFNKNAIVLFSDENYINYAKIVVQSIIETSSKTSKYDVIILSDADLDNTFNTPDNVSVRIMKTGIDLEQYNLYESGFISKASYYRLFIPKIFSQYEKVLYLDCDLVLIKNIDEIFDMDFEDNVIIACPEFCFWTTLCKKDNNLPKDFIDNRDYYYKFLGLNENIPYINSGVILFNIKNSNDFQFTEKCLDLIKNNPYEFFLYHDQDIINGICNGHIKFLEDKYNYLWCLASSYAYSVRLPRKNLIKERDLYQSYYNDAKIIHYASRSKPWSKPYYDYKLGMYWWRYASHTDIFHELLGKMSKSVKRNILDNLEKTEVKIKTHFDFILP